MLERANSSVHSRHVFYSTLIAGGDADDARGNLGCESVENHRTRKSLFVLLFTIIPPRRPRTWILNLYKLPTVL